MSGWRQLRRDVRHRRGRPLRRARTALRADAVRRLHVVLKLHVIFEADPLIGHLHFPAPGADSDKMFQKTQPPKNPEGGGHDGCAEKQNRAGLEPIFLRPRRRFQRAQKAKRDVGIFIQPNQKKNCAESNQLQRENELFVNALFSHLRKSSGLVHEGADGIKPIIVDLGDRPAQSLSARRDCQRVATDKTEVVSRDAALL